MNTCFYEDIAHYSSALRKKKHISEIILYRTREATLIISPKYNSIRLETPEFTATYNLNSSKETIEPTNISQIRVSRIMNKVLREADFSFKERTHTL